MYVFIYSAIKTVVIAVVLKIAIVVVVALVIVVTIRQ
jgi:hypothetical protein